MSNKLYTEKQVRQMLFDLGDVLFNNCQNGIKEGKPLECAEIILEDVTPIELPSDEEIEANAKYNPTNGLKWNPIMKITWVEGAKWMRDKIQGGNNEQ